MSARFEEVQWLLIDIIGDLLAPNQVFVERGDGEIANNELYMPINRMCLTQIIISLCKFDEIYRHYHSEFNLLPHDLLTKVKGIKQEIEKRNVYSFRSTYIGHAFKKESGKQSPMTADEIEKGFNKVLSNDQVAFHDWIFPLDEMDRNGTSVVEVLNEAVQFFRSEYSLKPRL